MSDTLELLALSAGTWGCTGRGGSCRTDAVYIGGKRFNMRLLKGD